MRTIRLSAKLLWVILLGGVLPLSAHAATLTWQDASTNELGFEVERATAPCSPVPTSFAKIGEVGANIQTSVDATPEPGNRYCYRLRAWNLAYPTATQRQYSPYSNLAEYAYPLPAPVAPGQLQVAPGQ